MNIIFGTTNKIEYNKANQICKERYGTPLTLTETDNPYVYVGIMGDGNISIDSNKISIGSTLPFYKNKPTDIDVNSMFDTEGQYSLIVTSVNDMKIFSDSSGLRTVYYTNQGKTFSTNLKLLADVQGKPLNRKHENFMLMHGFIPYEETMYEEVYALGSNEYIHFSDGIMSVKPKVYGYFPKLFPIDNTINNEEILYNLFMEALKKQSDPNKKHGVLLGGFDSALVAAGLVEMGCEVETFSFKYEDESYDQPYVNELSEMLGIKHHWVDITPKKIESMYSNYAHFFNKPTNWPNYVISTAIVCEYMKNEGIEIVLSGDGCDTIFLGYPGTYKRAKITETFEKIPDALKQSFVKLFESKKIDEYFGHPYRVTMGMAKNYRRSLTARNLLSFRIMDETTIRNIKNIDDIDDIDDIANDIANEYTHLPTYRTAYAGKSLVSPNKTKMVGSSDYSGLTIWSPYMDPSLKAFASALPEETMRPDTSDSPITGKVLLQKMAISYDLLTEDIVYQPKVAAVDAPVDEWNQTEFYHVLKKNFEGLPFNISSKTFNRLIKTSYSERVFRDKIMIDKVVSHAVNFLATYGTFGLNRKNTK